MDLILNVLLAVLLARAVFNALFTIRTVSWLSRHAAAVIRTPTPRRPITLVLAVYQEADRIVEALHYASDTARAHVDRCIVVGNIRERQTDGRNPTLEAASAAISGDDWFQILESPELGGIKAHQINYALGRHPAQHADDLVFMVDIDSRYGAEVFSEIRIAAARGARIIQQHAVFLAHYERLPFIQKCHALYQSRWTISHEIKNMALARWTGWYVTHVVGHGLAIERGLLADLGGMPQSTTLEDMQLGYYVAATGVPVTSLQRLEVGETPDSFIAAVRQQFGWAFGPLRYRRYRQLMRLELPGLWRRHRLRSAWVSFLGLMTFANWLGLAPALAFIGLCAAAGLPLAWASLAAYLLELVTVAAFFAHQGWIRPSAILPSCAMMLVHVPVRCLAAWRAAAHVLAGRPVVRLKTANRS